MHLTIFARPNALIRHFCNMLLLSGVLVCCAAPEAMAFQEPVRNPTPRDSVIRKRAERRDSRIIGGKRFGAAALQLGLAELVPWSIDNYIRKVDYTKITWKTTGYNLNPGHWAWDNDNFQTNQFGHPYHGSLFFNSFRTKGYTFWESAPAVAVGSYLWETFGENQAPAPNDFINTTFGGIVLGEMTYRLSNKVINNRARGFKRQASEVIALLINPMNGLSRIVDGRWGKIRRNTTERDSSRVLAEFDVGFRTFNNNQSGIFNYKKYGWFGRARLLYGTPYEEYKKAFSNISIQAEFGKDDSTTLNMVNVYGSLSGWELASDSRQRQLLVISANYDYLRNAAFFYGAQSVKANLYSAYNISKKIKIDASLGAGVILLAAVPDDYLYKGRDYDYGSGFGLSGGGKISIAGKIFYSLNYRGGWFKTINGNESNYFIHTFSSEFSWMVIKGLSLCAEQGYYNLHGDYKNYKDVDKDYPYLKAAVRYSVDIR